MPENGEAKMLNSDKHQKQISMRTNYTRRIID